MPMSPRLLRPRQVGGFDPRRISGIYSWYDAADLSTLTLNTANSPNTVSEWRDKAASRHLANANSASQPVITTQNGRNALSFVSKNFTSSVASSEWFFLHQPSELYDVFMVCRSNVRSVFGTGWLATFNANNANVGFVWGHSNVSMVATVSAGGSQNAAVSTINMDSPTQDQQVMRAFHLAGDVSNATAGNRLLSSSSNGRVSGNATSTNASPSSAASQLNLIVGSGMNGVMCEVIFYKGTVNLAASERDAVMNYLIAKWGL